MTQETLLRRLAGRLCGKGKKLFPNQVVFYHVLFAFTQKNICSESLCGQLRVLLARHGSQMPEAAKPQARQLRFIVTQSLDGNSANIGKHINNHPDSPLPLLHREHFLIAEERNGIILRLQTIFHYFWVCRQEKHALAPEDVSRMLPPMGDGHRGQVILLRSECAFQHSLLKSLFWGVKEWYTKIL
ncbi:hypothetical protein D3Z51_08945 [Clostridiaceae bacterium]|nr:hypothetical protein [Clostridiaceae bacterium]RKI14387.1 hypothetical protein D7V81_08430 [bacterium 1XD21-70]